MSSQSVNTLASSLGQPRISAGLAATNFSTQPTNSSWVMPGTLVPTDNVSVRARTSKRKTFRERFCELSTELRCLVYDTMVSHRAIEVLQPKEHPQDLVDPLQRKNHLRNTDAIHQLYIAEKHLRNNISRWLNARKELRYKSEVGIFDPRNAIFLLDFQWLPISSYFGCAPGMDEEAPAG